MRAIGSILAAAAAAAAAAALVGMAACGDPDPGKTFQPWYLEELAPADGFSIRIPRFEVPPRGESQNCYFVQVPDVAAGEDLWVDRVVMAINPGSHHMNVFRVNTIINLGPEDGTPIQLGPLEGTVVEGLGAYATHPCWDSANWADWPLVANSQEARFDDPYTDWQLPDEVAIRLTPGEWLMVQTHYVNTTAQPTEFGAKVGINFYRTAEQDPQELGTLFATQQNIRVCQSNPQVTYSGTCQFPTPVTITAANGHFHSRGDQFRIYSWDGDSIEHPEDSAMFYESTRWDAPPMTTDIERPAPAGSGIWWDCQYRWRQPEEFTCDDINAKDTDGQDDCCYTFGGNTDIGEHCNVFLYYYPKVESDIFCL